jgi:hypothetical protein
LSSPSMISQCPTQNNCFQKSLSPSCFQKVE